MALSMGAGLLIFLNLFIASQGLAGKSFLDKHALHQLFDDNAEQSAWHLEPQEVNIITKVVQLARGHTPIIRQHLLPVFEKVENGQKLLDDALRALEEDPEEPEDDWQHPGCSTCIILMTALKGAAAVIDWEQIRDPAYFICIHVGVIVQPWLRADVLCSGVIDSQGPLIHDVLRSVNTFRRHCEFLNSCYPPRPEGMTEDYPFLPPAPSQSTMKQKIDKELHAKALESAIKVVAIADVHVEPHYAAGSSVGCGLPMCCLSRWGPGPAGRWGDYACNVAEETMDLFTRKIQELGADFVVQLGDTPHHHIWDDDEETRLGCNTKLANAIRRDAPGVPAYPTLGNHENYPTNIYYMDSEDQLSQNLNERLITDWRDLANFTPEDEASIRASGYYATRVKPGLILISWNSNYMFADNWYNVISEGVIPFPGPVPPARPNHVRDMQAFVENAFEEARQNGDKVIFIGHHLLGSGSSIISFTRWLTDLCVKYKDIIVLQPTGHSHTDQFRVVRDMVTGEPATLQLGVAVMDTGSTRNPSIRVFYLDPTDFTLLDFDQYHMDLREALNTETPEIKHVYRATEEYGLPDMSPHSWWDFIARMLVDPELMNRFEYNRITRVNPGNCPPGSCTISRLCMLSNSNTDYIFHCNQVNAPEPPPTTTTTTTAPTTTTEGEPPETGSASQNIISTTLFLCVLMLILI